MAKIAPVTRERLDSLPEWAKRHIATLEMRLEESKRELTKFQDEKTPSEFAIQRFDPNGGRELVYLPPNRTLVAFLDKKHGTNTMDRQSIFLAVRGDDARSAQGGRAHLEISTWHRYPLVSPQAANTLRVRLTEEY